MASKRNFLLGRGELLTGAIEVKRSGGPKQSPYTPEMTVKRISKMLANVNNSIANLPQDACPEGKAVLQLTMHPRYISKSDYPSELFAMAKMRAIGGKSIYVEPEQWGVENHPEGSVTDSWYVSTSIESLNELSDRLMHSQLSSDQILLLSPVENITAPTHGDKLKMPENGCDSHLFEAVLHSEGSPGVVDAFYSFLDARESVPVKERVRFSGGVVFCSCRN